MRQQKENDPLTPWERDGRTPAVTPLSLFGLLAVFLTVISFFLWDDGIGTGEISRTVSYFEDFFNENETVAVFLGWEGE